MIEDIYLVPREGEFPVADIERFVAALPSTFRDAGNEHVFLVSENDDVADYNRRKNREDVGSYPSSATIIKVYPARIDVSWRRHAPEQARTFVRWMCEQYGPRIEDAEDNDLTAACGGDLDVLFGK